jgi:hypothetical protein
MDTLDVAVQAYSEGGLLAPEKPSTDGNLQELWRTPSSSDGEGVIMEMRPGTAGKYKLRDHVHANWATPNAGDRTKRAPEKRKTTHKLNPRFVETLMGLPIGWVMPNCAKPISTGITNSVPLAMESSPLNAPTATEPLLIN